MMTLEVSELSVVCRSNDGQYCQWKYCGFTLCSIGSQYDEKIGSFSECLFAQRCFLTEYSSLIRVDNYDITRYDVTGDVTV